MPQESYAESHSSTLNAIMKTESGSPPLPTVLYFENNERDLLLLRMAAAACNVSYTIAGFSDLSAAKNFLMEALSGERALPNFLLVDYSHWKEDGLSLVHWVHADPTLQKIPTIMCSDQQGLAAVHICYEAGANYYLTKMGSYARLKQMLHTFDVCLNRMPFNLQAIETLPEYRQELQPNEKRKALILTAAQMKLLPQRKAALL